jgi:hypothetical protein
VKCPLCGSRRGKRRCPAKRADICAICCGEKRVVEIDCPQDCQWLRDGQANELRREWTEYLRAQAPEKARLWMSVMDGWLPVVDAVEQSVADAARSIRDLSDEETAEALAGVLKGYSAEANGILYRPSSTSPRVEAVSRDLHEGVEALRASVRKDGRGELPHKAILDSLQAVLDRVEFHRDRPASRSFVAHLRRVRAGAHAPDAGEGTRLVIP